MNEPLFFFGGRIYLYEKYMYWQCYIYVYHNTNCLLLGIQHSVPLRKFFTKEWGEPMPGVHASATKDEKEESSSTPPKNTDMIFLGRVCAPWPVI